MSRKLCILLILFPVLVLSQAMFLNNKQIKLSTTAKFRQYGSRISYTLLRLNGGSQWMQQSGSSTDQGREVLPYSPQVGKDSVRIMYMGDSNTDTEW